ncbi:hypothetical protein BO78DRAFT_218064 [Aspergillus sclerotiicarbonarius CBS 121057]|uniref:Uncharacterized protein n=1 Tax=Aspergillus sclerotiicarbonarius (strain CBS 121057 / IBT 28362) TaxID=1448318 RepID=A0A319EJ27_ASPSB|nr:hypothetical protein BO78DRAFT_218064 [Aspergillus sclerotiicarbonarius CBS 121057]
MTCTGLRSVRRRVMAQADRHNSPGTSLSRGSNQRLARYAPCIIAVVVHVDGHCQYPEAGRGMSGRQVEAGIANRRQEAGSRRQEAGGRRQEAGSTGKVGCWLGKKEERQNRFGPTGITCRS